MEKRHALITGGAQGIGKQAALCFLQNGFDVTIVDIDEEAGAETLNELKAFGRIQYLPGDISSEENVKVFVKKAVEFSGRLDVLINNAAVSANKPVTELSLEEWNRVLAVNVTSCFLFVKHAAPYLKTTQGTVINLCSTRAFMSEANTEAYSASKGAVYSLTHALAVSLGPEIRVNSVSPGWIEVSELKKSTDRKITELSEADHNQHPAGRVGDAKDIARLLLFLANEENSFITGQNFIIDGGMTRKMIYV